MTIFMWLLLSIVIYLFIGLLIGTYTWIVTKEKILSFRVGCIWLPLLFLIVVVCVLAKVFECVFHEPIYTDDGGHDF